MYKFQEESIELNLYSRYYSSLNNFTLSSFYTIL